MNYESLKADIIAITGHRDFSDTGALYRGLDNTFSREYMFGGARGADKVSLEYLARTQPGALRTVVVPNRLVDQPASARVSIGKYSTKVIELRNTGVNRYQLRNRFMVDNSNAVRAFYDGRGSGGTYNTINYAQSKGVNVKVWWLRPLDMRSILAKTPDEFNVWMRSARKLKVPLRAIKGIILEYSKSLAARTGAGFIQLPETQEFIQMY